MTALRGPLKVTIDTSPPFHDQDGVVLSRNTVRKSFSGPMTGASREEMIAVHTPEPGSAGYVALEHFTGTVDGRQGTFVMQHNSIIANGEPELSIVIVPSTGTGELVGITGTLVIDSIDGQHSYVLGHELP